MCVVHRAEGFMQELGCVVYSVDGGGAQTSNRPRTTMTRCRGIQDNCTDASIFLIRPVSLSPIKGDRLLNAIDESVR